MLSQIRAWALRLLLPAALFLAVGLTLVYLAIGALHLRYPFELESMEGTVVDEIRRVASGHRIYVRPSLDFVPFAYPPLYFYVSALVSKVTGVGFLAPRLVSYASSIGALALIARFVHRETGGDRASAVLAAGLLAATYPQGAAFFDSARVDALFLVLSLAALYLLRFHPTPRALAGAALLFALAFLTRQAALLVFLPAALSVGLADRRRGLIFLGAGLALMLGSALALDRLHNGWFWYFVFWLPSRQPVAAKMIYDFWIADLMAPLGLAAAFGLSFLVLGHGDPQGRRFYALTAAGLLGASWAGRLVPGGWPNALLPAFAALALLFGLGFHAALRFARGAPEAMKQAAEALVLVAAAGQLASLIYDPTRLVPTLKDRKAGQALVASIRAIDGEVFLPAESYLGVLAGKRGHANEAAMDDVLDAGGEAAEALRAELEGALRARRFAAIVPDTSWSLPAIEASYERKRDAPSNPAAFFTPSRSRMKPKGIYLPR